jgi:hypothetical protein
VNDRWVDLVVCGPFPSYFVRIMTKPSLKPPPKP